MLQSHKYNQSAAYLSVAYSLFSCLRTYYQQGRIPAADHWQQIKHHIIEDQLPLNPLLAEGLTILSSRDVMSEEAVYEYNCLFTGPGKLMAPPYESAYLNPEKTLMQEETLAVRRFYAQAGLEVRCKHSIPDDHLGMELEFICYLLSQAGKHNLKGNGSAAASYLELYGEFFRNHLRKWVYYHCNDILTHATTRLCRGMALVFLGIVETEEYACN